MLQLVWAGHPTFTEIATGEDFTCGRSAAGEVWCWGNNEDQQLGVARSTPRSAAPLDTGLRGAVDVAASGFAACAVLQSGRVMCWGQAFETEWGRGSLPREMGNLRDATQVALAPGRGCVRRRGGQVSCWDLSKPRLEQGPSPLPELSSIDEVAVGRAHACGRTQGGEVWCWGDDKRGQLGQDRPGWPARPIRIPGLVDVQQISAGDDTSCAVRSDGTVACWGPNSQGMLGLGHTAAVWGAQTLPNLSGIRRVSVSGSSVCALGSRGDVHCWGAEPCPRPEVPTRRTAPTPSGVPSALGLSEGAPSQHRCAQTGSAWTCWGYNSHQQAGPQDSRCVTEPRAIP